MEGITLEFDEPVLNLIVDKALEFKLGARGLRGICESIMVDFMFDAPSDVDASNPLFKQITQIGKAKAYPNPTSAVINLDISEYQDKTLNIQLLNMMGTQVKTKKVDAHSAQMLEIDVNDLPSGTYLLVIKSINTQGLTDQIQRINVIR